MSPRKSVTLSKDMVGQYLVAELDSLTQRALQQENALANKINFYLITITAVGSGLILAMGTQVFQNIILALSGLVCLIFHIMGWVTLYQGLDLRAGSIIMYRRMGRIRQWFLDYDPSLLPYMPFTPGDNRPLFYVDYAPIRSIESILPLVNAMTAGLFASFLWLFISIQVLQLKFALDGYPFLIALGIGIIISILLWLWQMKYIRSFMLSHEKWEEENSRIHFPINRIPNDTP